MCGHIIICVKQSWAPKLSEMSLRPFQPLTTQKIHFPHAKPRFTWHRKQLRPPDRSSFFPVYMSVMLPFWRYTPARASTCYPRVDRFDASRLNLNSQHLILNCACNKRSSIHHQSCVVLSFTTVDSNHQSDASNAHHQQYEKQYQQ